MGLSGGYSLLKLLLVLVNFILWVVGLAVVVLALWMLVDPTFYYSMTQDQNNYMIGLYIFLAAGILLLVAGYFGCCGAFRESRCMLVSFFSLLLVILVAEVAAGAWTYYNSDALQAKIRSSVENTVRSEYGADASRTETFDAIQNGLKCCGVDGPSNWKISHYNRAPSSGVEILVSAPVSPSYNIPKSCCREGITDDECKTATVITSSIGNQIYNEGCVDKLVEFINDHSKIIEGVTIGIIVVEILGLIFALILCFAINRRYKS